MRRSRVMNYKIIHQNDLCVVSLTGDISRDDRNHIQECAQELRDTNYKAVILYFKNVSAIDTTVFRDFTLLQHEIRQKQAKLRLAGLNVSLKNLLGEKGVIRGSEVQSTLPEAIADLNR